MKLEGIHHITCVTADAPSNADFYVRVLGLRIVKKTVNQVDKTTYHVFYGDERASYGNNISFFEYRGRPNGRVGAGNVHTIVWRVGEEGALAFWERRLAGEGIDSRREETTLDFADPEGLSHRLAVVQTSDEPLTGESGRGSTPAVRDPDGRAVGATFLRNNLGKRSVAIDLKSDAGREVFLRLVPRFDVAVSCSTSRGVACRRTSTHGASASRRCVRMRPAWSTGTSSVRRTSPSPAASCSRSPSMAARVSARVSQTPSIWATSCSFRRGSRSAASSTNGR